MKCVPDKRLFKQRLNIKTRQFGVKYAYNINIIYKAESQVDLEEVLTKYGMVFAEKK